MTPRRIQRKRSKGWRMPEHTKCVTRPGRWGNPFKVGGFIFVHVESVGTTRTFQIDARASVGLYRCWLRRQIEVGDLDPDELRGWNLACYCPIGQACHADHLLDLANR